jgi:hypothetical protein
MCLFLAVIGVKLTQRMFEYSDVQWNQNTKHVNAETDFVEINIIAEDQLYFSFDLSILSVVWDGSYDLDQLLVVKISQAERKESLDENTTITFTKEDMENELNWNQSKFKNIQIPETKFAEDDTLQIFQLWFDFTNYTVGGADGNADFFKFFYIDIIPWYELLGANWIEQYEANLILENSLYSTLITNTNIDLNEISEPVVKTVTSLSYESFVLGKINVVALEIQSLEAVYQDDLFGLEIFSPKINKYIGFSDDDVKISSISLAVGEDEMSPIYIQITMNADIEQFNRKVFNFLELTGILGGIFEVFDVFFGFIIGIIANRMFKSGVKEDIAKAQKQYVELKMMIDELKRNQSNQSEQNEQPVSRQEHAEEEKMHPNQVDNQLNLNNFPSAHQMLNNSSQNADFMRDQVKADIKRIKLLSDYNKKVEEYDVNSFYKALDGVDLVFTVKTLREQVSYLLHKDKEYSEQASKKFEQEPNLYRRNLNLSEDDEDEKKEPRVHAEPVIEVYSASEESKSMDKLPKTLPIRQLRRRQMLYETPHFQN